MRGASCINWPYSTIFICCEVGDNQLHYQLIPRPRLSAIVFMCILISDMLLLIVTCLRSGPNWTDLREPPGRWRDRPTQPAVSTMMITTPNCWLLGDWVRGARPSVMPGYWTSTLGGGGRWGRWRSVLCVWPNQVHQTCASNMCIKHVHDEKCIKQFHFMCGFIIWCLFSYSSKYLQK